MNTKKLIWIKFLEMNCRLIVCECHQNLSTNNLFIMMSSPLCSLSIVYHQTTKLLLLTSCFMPHGVHSPHLELDQSTCTHCTGLTNL
jgi:hypothetical protein